MRLMKDTPLIAAVSDGADSLVETLINGGVDVSEATMAGITPLWMAASKGHDSIVTMLVGAGADVDLAPMPNYQTPLWEATRNLLLLMSIFILIF